MLGPIGVQGHALDVAAVGDGDDHVLARDQVLVLHLAIAFPDQGAARHGELGPSPVDQVVADDGQDVLARSRQDGQVALDGVGQAVRASPKMSSRPRPVRRLTASGPRMARACSSVRFGSCRPRPAWSAGRRSARPGPSCRRPARLLACSRSRASVGSAEERMMWMTSSILATATARPTSTWPRSRALFSSNLTRRTTTSSRKSRKASSN